jgi:hypothetical protein
MIAMEGFDHLLNWKLKAGSHPLPGKDGGTCINEAALVAAGFEYQPIRSVDDMPECFSRPICRFALYLNDKADDEERQRLLPFVTRLACADTPEVERKRAGFIRRHASRWLFGPSFERGLRVLEGALAIGRQANPLGSDQVTMRMDAVKTGASTSTSIADDPVLPKLKDLFKQAYSAA